MVRFAVLFLVTLLVGCDGPTQEPVVVEKEIKEENSASERDIPLTEIVRTENEKDLRLINALRAYLPMLMHTYSTPGLNIAVARRGEIVWKRVLVTPI